MADNFEIEDGKIPYAECKALIPFAGLPWVVMDKSDIPPKTSVATREQFYWDGDEIKVDTDFSVVLMHDHTIKKKHLTHLNSQIDAELAKQTPNVVELIRLQREYQTVKERKTSGYNKDPFWINIALASLSRSQKDTTIIEQKLQQKKQELENNESVRISES